MERQQGEKNGRIKWEKFYKRGIREEIHVGTTNTKGYLKSHMEPDFCKIHKIKVHT